MANYNKVMLMGNLTRDPEIRYTPKGTAVAEIGMAVNRYFSSETGEKREETTFVDVTLWGRTAEIAGEYLKKGRTVYIEGALRTSSWDDKESGQKKYKTEVIVNDLVMLGGGEGAGGGKSRGAAANSGMDQRAPEEVHSQAAEITDDDIPF